VVGGGVIGLSIGTALLEHNSMAKVTVVEKETILGAHASGRNSGVIHAGFYYSPESLKAKFCADGNKELKALCRKYEIRVKEIGKVVVTKKVSELGQLEKLFHRGLTNGIDIELKHAKDLVKIEPAASTVGKFIWSPTTAIADPKAVINQLAENFKNLGGRMVLGSSVSIVNSGGEIHGIIDGKQIRADFLVNAAGVHADRLARSIGVGLEFVCLPFMGVYRVSKQTTQSAKTLIYPVPHLLNPFLGAHLTITLNGEIKIGPTAIPLLGREQYSLKSRVSVLEFRDVIAGARALIRGKEYDFPEIVRSELPKVVTRLLIKNVAEIVPDLRHVNSWTKLPPGIRAQLVNLKSGALEQDFVVRKHANSIHILNAVSPGWTSALPFGRWVAKLISNGESI
jgi:L-2-hydroxyglutarate oxidase LhgO